MRVLVIGATSNTGRRLCARLLEQGHHVVCFTRRAEGLPAEAEIVVGHLPGPGEGWGESGTRFDEAAAGCSVVFNLTHIRFAPRVVARARAAGVMRTVCVSSARRFTRWPDEPARAVIAAEAELASDPAGWVALRATMICGGGRDKNIARLVRLVRRWPVIPLPGGGRRLIQPLFVDDLVEALLAASHAPEVAGRIIDVAGPEPISLREAVRVIARALGRRRVIVPVPLAPARWAACVFRRSALGRVRRLGEDRVLDIAEARQLLGFAPRPFAENICASLESSPTA